MAIILLVSVVVVLVMCVTIFTADFIIFKRNILRSNSTLGEVIAAHCASALENKSRDDAREFLSAVRVQRHVVAAAIYDKDGKLFATYPANVSSADIPRLPEADGNRFTWSRMLSFRPVVRSGQRLGTLYIDTDMEALHERFRAYGWISALVIIVSIPLAFLLSRQLEGQITNPILALAESAREISARRDYSMRARKLGNDELGLLTDAFNQMLDKIQAQLARLDLLGRTTHAIAERQDLASICQVVVCSLEDHLPIDFGCVCSYDAAAKTLSVISVGVKGHALASELALSDSASIEVGKDGLLRCVEGHLVYEPDVSKIDTPFVQRLARGGLRSMVVSPLSVESITFGILIVARRLPNSFDSAECEFLKQVGEHTALAARHAQLYGSLQQAYEELRHSRDAFVEQDRLRALGQMASGIAHDINNSITPVSVYVQSLLDTEPNLSERARDYLETMHTSVRDIAETVARMRDFYRGRESGAPFGPVQLNRLIRQVIQVTRAKWSDMPQQRGFVIKANSEAAPDLPAIMGVESEIREALVNLIFNAVDAMPEGGNLTLRTRVAQGSGAKTPETRLVCVEVIDTGAGMDEETRSRCLEPFFTTKGDRGTGLGLAMVYGTIQRHRAEIEIESQVGRGTTVRLIFPVAETAVAGLNKPEASAAVGPLRILLVDDDPLVRKTLRNVLESESHSVRTADGGEAGIFTFTAAQTRGQPFDVVITDLGMPDIDGRKVAGTIKEKSPTTPIILLTGWGQRLIDEGAIPPHVDRVLSKPPKLRELREALAHCYPHVTPK
jgi:signal transduction histidine kinase/ActR/RegA family two-component response regulator/HAMP domain-containing protein